MDDLLQKNTAAATGSPAPQTMAGQPPGKPPGNAPPIVPGAIATPLFGGNRGGRKRKDGLTPGSPQAIEADKKADRERKREKRDEAAKLADPPPLPAAGPGVAGPGMPAGGLLVPGDALAPPPPIPWQAEDLAFMIDELVESAEKGRIQLYLTKCSDAGLTGTLVKEIEKDAHLPKTAKTMLARSIPRLTAKWMNKTGVSAEWQDEVFVFTAFVLIIFQGRRLEKRFDDMVAKLADEKKKAEKAKEAKP